MFKAITPKFINKLDDYLLVNYPVLWMSKIHYALWHSIVLWGLSALLGLIVPIDLKTRIEYELWYFLFTVISVLLFCFWVYRYVIFNKDKNYGARKFGDEYKNFILVFITILTFLTAPWPFEMIYNNRIANSYTDEEIIEDINTLNETNLYLAHRYSAYYSWYDSVSNVQYYNLRRLAPYGSDFFTPYYMKSDSSRFPNLKTDTELAREYKPTTDKRAVMEKIDRYASVAGKYNVGIYQSSGVIAEKYIELLSKPRVTYDQLNYYDSDEYKLQTIFENVCQAKFKTLFIFNHDYLWVIFYTIITLASFLLLFKITYWQQFLINIVILMLYPLIIFILSELMPYGSGLRGDDFVQFMLLALILFAGITLFITWRTKTYYKPFYNIMNQLFYVTIIGSPVLLIVFLRETTNTFHNHDYSGYYPDYVTSSIAAATDMVVTPGVYETRYVPTYRELLSGLYNDYWYAEYHRWIEYAKYFGIVSFILALPVFNSLFVKQISLPKKR